MFQFGKFAIASTVSTMGTMAISVRALTDILEMVNGIFLVKTFRLGLTAVWIGIFVDWIVRAIIFAARFVSGKWLHEDIIGRTKSVMGIDISEKMLEYAGKHFCAENVYTIMKDDADFVFFRCKKAR